jgi:signal transduction histidine kinase
MSGDQTPHDSERSRIVHDLRSPLHALAGYLDLAIADNDNPELGRLLAGARRAAHELDDLVAELSGSPDPTTDVDLDEIVCSVVEMLRPIAGDHTLDVGLGPSPSAHTAGRAVRRIVTNLITNAIRHSPTGTTIAVRTLASSPTIIITDEGPGPAALPDSTERSGRLGLAIVRELVDRIGGQLVIGSGEHGGTRISVALPAPCTPM